MQIGAKLGLVEAGWNSGRYIGGGPLGGDAAVALSNGRSGGECARVTAGDFAFGGEPCFDHDSDHADYSSGGRSAVRSCRRPARKLSIGRFRGG